MQWNRGAKILSNRATDVGLLACNLRLWPVNPSSHVDALVIFMLLESFGVHLEGTSHRKHIPRLYGDNTEVNK